MLEEIKHANITDLLNDAEVKRLIDKIIEHKEELIYRGDADLEGNICFIIVHVYEHGIDFVTWDDYAIDLYDEPLYSARLYIRDDGVATFKSTDIGTSVEIKSCFIQDFGKEIKPIEKEKKSNLVKLANKKIEKLRIEKRKMYISEIERLISPVKWENPNEKKAKKKVLKKNSD